MQDDPLKYGEQIAQSLPGVNILMMLRKLGEQIPGVNDAMRYLGIPQQHGASDVGAGGPQYRIDQPLPRSGGVDAQGNPIIIPPGGSNGSY